MLLKVVTWQNMVDEWQIIRMVRSQETISYGLGWSGKISQKKILIEELYNRLYLKRLRRRRNGAVVDKSSKIQKTFTVNQLILSC